MLIPLLGIRFNENFFIHIAPLFGCTTSELACARATWAVVQLLIQEGFFSLCYLDDFVGLGNVKEKMRTMLNVLHTLRIWVYNLLWLNVPHLLLQLLGWAFM